MPLVLSSISRWIRIVVNGTPWLWANIIFTPSWGAPRTNLYLARSGTAPLTVSIEFDEHVMFGSTVRTESLLSILDSHRRRILRFEAFFVERPAYDVTLEWLCSETMKKLHHVGIGLSCQSTMPTDEPAFQMAASKFPKIRSIRTEGVAMTLWTGLKSKKINITSLDVCKPRAFPGAKFIAALKTMSESLERLALDLVWFTERQAEDDDEAITLPRLHTLSLTRMDEVDEEFLVDWLETPALRAIAISQPYHIDQIVGGEIVPHSNTVKLKRLIARNPQLTSLDVTNARTERGVWSTLLPQLGNLEHLRFTWCYIEDEDIMALNSSFVCPRLTSLAIDNELAITSQAVRLVIQMRIREGRRPLQSLSMRGVPRENIEEQDVEFIRSVVPNFCLGDFSIVDYDSDPESSFEPEGSGTGDHKDEETRVSNGDETENGVDEGEESGSDWEVDYGGRGSDRGSSEEWSDDAP